MQGARSDPCGQVGEAPKGRAKRGRVSEANTPPPREEGGQGGRCERPPSGKGAELLKGEAPLNCKANSRRATESCTMGGAKGGADPPHM